MSKKIQAGSEGSSDNNGGRWLIRRRGGGLTARNSIWGTKGIDALSMSRDEPGNQVAISKVEILILHLEKAGSSPARDKRGMLASRKRKGKEDGHDRLVAE